MRQTREKVRAEDGFTMAEMLLAVIILLLAAAIMVTGIPAAKNAYEKVVLAANADVLLSTTISALRNELGTARDVDIPDGTSGANGKTGTSVSYTSLARGASSRILVDSEKPKDGILIQLYYDAIAPAKTSAAEQLIHDKTATGDLYVTYTSVAYDSAKGVVTFNDLSVNRKNGSTGLAVRDAVSIRLITD